MQPINQLRKATKAKALAGTLKSRYIAMLNITPYYVLMRYPPLPGARLVIRKNRAARKRQPSSLSACSLPPVVSSRK